MLSEEEPSGQAADTGSAVHFAARLFHDVKSPYRGDIRMSAGGMREAVRQFPLADLDMAETQFRCYAADPRNSQAEVVLCERKVEIVLAPVEEDPTQEEIVIVGTLDQVRRKNGKLIVWDIKTGSPDGIDMLNTHAMQIAGYQFGASQVLGEPVLGAGVIRTKDYIKTDRSRRVSKPGAVFYEAPWSYGDLEAMLLAVRIRVCEIRSGRVYASPGAENCKWCIGVGNCIPQQRRLNVSLLQRTGSA